jgi:hypothetical protein
MKTQITIREVDKGIFQEFKAEAVRRGMTLGEAATFAMANFRSGRRKKFSEWVPVSWGKGTEHTSEQVDEVLYGADK